MTGLHPPLRPFGALDVFVPTGPESADFDAWAIEERGVPQPVLMENAGRAAAQLLQRLWPEGRVVGIVGGGNNGGDALVALRTLRAWGREVEAVLVADRPAADPLAHGWDLPGVRDVDLDDEAWSRRLETAGVIVDGVLGTGVRGAPRKRQAAAIARMAAASRPVLALDVPSGVDGVTGAVPGAAVDADVTVAFGAPKLGSLLHPGRALVGRLVAVEIGFPPAAGRGWARLVTPLWAQARLPGRVPDTHKNAVGRVLIVAGGAGMGGAAVLTARAAFRAGAGLVQLCCAPEHRAALHAALPEAIFVDPDDATGLDAALAETHALVAGPGLGRGPWAEAILGRALAGPPVPTVLDADALNLVAEGRATPADRIGGERPLLLTPHAGEMARLRPEEAGTERTALVRETADAFRCAVLLKGGPSLVAAPGGALLVDALGSSDLAVAGMGDALTGACGALLAQGLGPAEAAAVGLYLSGRAAVLAGRGKSLVPSDVVRRLPDALGERGAGTSDLGLPFVVFDQDPAR